MATSAGAGIRPDVDQLRTGNESAGAHFLGVARQAEAPLDLGRRDERSLALASVDPLLDLETLEDLSYGPARDLELRAELAFGR